MRLNLPQAVQQIAARFVAAGFATHLGLAAAAGLLGAITPGAPTQAQEREERGGRDDRGGREDRGGRGDRGSRRFDPKDFLSRMDANGNGMLDAGEISDRSRGFLESAARDAGIDLSQPVSVQRMAEAMEKRAAAREAERAGGTSGAGSSGGASSSGSPPAVGSSGSSSSSGAKPGLPGFGAPTAAPPVLGFDAPPPSSSASKKYDQRVVDYVAKMLKDYDSNGDGVLDKAEIEKAPWQSDPRESDANRDGKLDREELNARIAKRFGAASPPPPASTSSGSSSSSSSGGSGDAAKVRMYAEGLLRQNDANKNGVLDKDEWANVRAIPRDTDANNDGNVTLDELTIKLAAFGKEGSSGGSTAGSGSSSGSTPSGSSSSSDRSSGRGGSSYGSRSSGASRDGKASTEIRSYRQKSPAERLPKGLPDWFARNDADGDGQVVMSEYTATWSESKAAEFAKYDLDSDGVITPRECLRTLELEATRKSSSSSSSSSSRP
ncbi:MAG: hypothetical protein U0939_11550 [Pirellulales bacterium]